MLQQRLNRLRKILKEKKLDAFLVSNFFNILYLSGFKTLTENEREAWMLITSKNSYLFSDSRYLSEKIASDSPHNDITERLITPEKALIKHLEEIFQEEKIKNCGVEEEDLKIGEFHSFIRYLKETKFFPAERIIIKQREIKDEDEIKKIEKACEISDECLKETLRLIKVGKTEKEIAFKIEFWLKEKNYDLAFYPIIAIYENSAIIHYDTRSGNNKKVKNDSLILIDFGTKYQNYLSDITRMVFVGTPNDDIVTTYNKLLNIQRNTVEKSKNNTICSELDLFCREKINYPHSTGHGVGLEIHEYPKISPVSKKRLLTNQVVTIEPGIYFEGKWGMRIEDTVLVKEKNAEPLTKFSKDLIVL